MQKAAAPDRLAAGWYSPVSLTIDLNITDGQTHRVAFYCLDWDTTTRVQTVEVLDALSGFVFCRRRRPAESLAWA